MGEEKHRAYVNQYVRDSEVSPDGAWFREVPVGFSQVEPDREGSAMTKKADAVCLTSRDSSIPLTDREIQPDRYRRLWEEGEFVGETAVVIEAKTEGLDLKSIGQAQAYTTLLESEWELEVEEVRIVTSKKEPILEEACEHLGINIQLYMPSITHTNNTSVSDGFVPSESEAISQAADRPHPDELDKIQERFPNQWSVYQNAERHRREENLSVEKYYQRYKEMVDPLSKEEFFTGRRNP